MSDVNDDVNNDMPNAPAIGERIIVNGIMHTKAHVKKRLYNEKTREVVLVLDWGHLGESKVYLHDEGETWYRYASTN